MIEDSIKWIQDVIDKDPVIGKNLTLVKEVEMLTALTAKLRFHLNNNIFTEPEVKLKHLDNESTTVSGSKRYESSSPDTWKLFTSITPFQINPDEEEKTTKAHNSSFEK